MTQGWRDLDVSEPRLDPQELAALLDGRLDAARRAELLAQIADSDEAAEVLADAAALAGGAARSETPTGAGRGLPGSVVARVLLAAAVLAVLLVPAVIVRTRTGGGDGPSRYVTLLGSAATLPAAWNGAPWPRSRGAAPRADRGAMAVRLGARLVDLELALRAGDGRAAGLATEAAAMLEPVPAAQPTAALFRAVARQADAPDVDRASLLRTLRRGSASARDLVGAEAVGLGGWVEAARVAAARHDAGFLRSGASRAALRRAAALARAESARGGLEDVRRLIGGRGPLPWTALSDALDRLLATLAA